MKVHVISRHGRRQRVVRWQQTDRRPRDVRGVPQPLHRGDQRCGSRREGGGATEIVVVDCHGAGGDWTFNSLVPELLDPGCDWVAHHKWSGYTELLDRVATPLSWACTRCRHARGVLSHTISSHSWRISGSTTTRWRERDHGRALRPLGLPVLMVTGDEAICRRNDRAAGRRDDTVAVKRGIRPLRRAR